MSKQKKPLPLIKDITQRIRELHQTPEFKEDWKDFKSMLSELADNLGMENSSSKRKTYRKTG